MVSPISANRGLSDATPIKKAGKLISSGNTTYRVTFKNNKDIALAIKNKAWKGDLPEPKLHFWEKGRYVILHINDNGEDLYVKVNKNSLMKRFGFTKDQLKGKTEVTELVSQKLSAFEKGTLPNAREALMEEHKSKAAVLSIENCIEEANRISKNDPALAQVYYDSGARALDGIRQTASQLVAEADKAPIQDKDNLYKAAANYYRTGANEPVNDPICILELGKLLVKTPSTYIEGIDWLIKAKDEGLQPLGKELLSDNLDKYNASREITEDLHQAIANAHPKTDALTWDSFNLGEKFLKRNYPKLASIYFKAAVEQQAMPEKAGTMNLAIGLAYYKNKNYDAAITYYEAAANDKNYALCMQACAKAKKEQAKTETDSALAAKHIGDAEAYYQKAMDVGGKEATLLLGDLLVKRSKKGNDVVNPEDYKKGIDLLLQEGKTKKAVLGDDLRIEMKNGLGEYLREELDSGRLDEVYPEKRTRVQDVIKSANILIEENKRREEQIKKEVKADLEQQGLT